MNKVSVRVLLAMVCVSALTIGCGKGATSAESGSEKPVNQALLASNPALALVERFDMGSNLEPIALQIATTTVAYQMVVQKHGAPKAQQVVRQEIKNLLPMYQSKWNNNLAKAYTNNLSTEEIRSLVSEGKKSPFLPKLGQVQKLIADDMQKSARPILEGLLTEALKNAVR